MNLNMNRVIEITPTADSVSNWSSWRDNVSHILGGSDVNGKNFLSLSNYDDFKVRNDVHLLMDKDPKVFKSQNSFGQPVKSFMERGSVKKITDKIKLGVDIGLAIFNGGNKDTLSKSWQPWGQDIKAWEGSRGGVNFEYEFNFALGQYGIWNAYEEVVKPVINLVTPALPRNIGTFTMTGPFPNVFDLLAKMVKQGFWGSSEDSESEFKDTEEESGFLQRIGESINNLLLKSYNGFTYTVKFGNIMTFERVAIINASANFSNKVDQYGWPIKGSAVVSFQGMVPIAVSAPGNLMTTRFGNN